ncbi:uncharacterized protein LOC143921047 [Arctopsyche grandis]|uniref:uncharacterized protein LOC143921047 n=1 Tax=Arctopsyche grandis TaxID=121162 RepID=UPI00406D6F8C
MEPELELELEPEPEPEMAPAPAESLFCLREVCQFPSSRTASLECGRYALVASASERALLLVLIHNDTSDYRKRPPVTHVETWKFAPPLALCFDPTGNWLVCATAQPEPRLHIVRALKTLTDEPYVAPPGVGRWSCEWPLSAIPLPLEAGRTPTAITWWQTANSLPIVIVGDQTGGLLFLSLDTLKVIGKSYIVGRVCELAICVDDDLDTVDLLITSSRNRQWHLTLEKRCSKNSDQTNSDKKKQQAKVKDVNKKIDSFLTSIKELGSDKVYSLFQRSQSTSNVPDKLASHITHNNPTPICLKAADDEDDMKSDFGAVSDRPNLYQLIVSPQNAAGYHFISILNSSTGTFSLHCNIENRDPVLSYKLEDFPIDIYKVLWQKLIIYSFSTNTLKIHSCHLSLKQNSNQHTVIWEDSLNEGEYLVNAWTMSRTQRYPQYYKQWCNTTEVEKLALPRFNLGSCIVVTNKKVYLLTPSCDPCEFLVRNIIDGISGTERLAAALEIRLQDLLLGAADILLTNGIVNRALPLYRLAKIPSDDILMRFGALGMLKEMLTCELHPQTCSTANICFIAHTLHELTRKKENKKTLLNFICSDTHFDVITCARMCAELGIWHALDKIAFHKGLVWLGFETLIHRLSTPCRGLLSTVLNQNYAPFIITDSGLPLLKFIDQYCDTFDNFLLKKLCLWMCPLQDCFRISFRALCTSQSNSHLSGMRRLIRTFFGVVSTLYSRMSVNDQLLLSSDIKKEKLLHHRDSISANSKTSDLEGNVQSVVSCGHTHWGIVSQGKISLLRSSGSENVIHIDIDMIGKALDVSCGREHTLILTENGVYSIGDNRFGQLGVGNSLAVSIDTPMLVGAMKKWSLGDGAKTSRAWHNERVVQVAAGQYHSACVTDTGCLYTWGWGVHGQLGHGYIYNEFYPKKVMTMRSSMKVAYVGCGSCHTVILTTKGRVYVCGNSAFGQIGDSSRQKSNVPLKINLGSSPVTKITVGYFHTLALTLKNEVWTWGSSPQKLRLGARSAKLFKMKGGVTESQDDSCIPTSLPIMQEDNTHLYPTKIDLSHIRGKIVEMAAGWHHSCVVDSMGYLYVWGLNLDCQLGTGDRNEVYLPTSVEVTKVKCDQPLPDGTSRCAKKADSPPTNRVFLANVSCGGDFTVFVKNDGNVFITGNSYLQDVLPAKGELRVVMFKNTKRIVRLPKPHANLQKTFRHVPQMSNFLHQLKTDCYESKFDWPQNPVHSNISFEDPSWATKVVACLYEFVDDDTPLMDAQLRAVVASLRGDFVEALNLQLTSLYVGTHKICVPWYVQHVQRTVVYVDQMENQIETRASETLRNKIKYLSQEWLHPSRDNNERDLEDVDLECQCCEPNYMVTNAEFAVYDSTDEDVLKRAIAITRAVMRLLPDDSKVWTDCINEATKFWMERKLDMNELENVLLETASEGQAINMASAVFCAKDRINYQKHLSSTFNLELCDNILQSWS